MRAHPALVLNADFQPLSYFPLSVIGWQDAIKAVYKGTHFVVEEYATLLRSPSTTMRIPSVLALKKYMPVPHHVAFTRFNVFLRDGFRCQYCGEKHASTDLTFDHVVPRSRGGHSSWENVVAACSPCNVIKDDRTDMKPFRMPREPTSRELVMAKRSFPPGFLHETWTDYLFWDSELQK